MNIPDLSDLKARIQQCQSKSALSNRYPLDVAQDVADYIHAQPATQSFAHWERFFNISAKTIRHWLQLYKPGCESQAIAVKQPETLPAFFEVSPLKTCIQDDLPGELITLTLGQGTVALSMHQLARLLHTSTLEQAHA